MRHFVRPVGAFFAALSPLPSTVRPANAIGIATAYGIDDALPSRSLPMVLASRDPGHAASLVSRRNGCSNVRRQASAERSPLADPSGA